MSDSDKWNSYYAKVEFGNLNLFNDITVSHNKIDSIISKTTLFVASAYSKQILKNITILSKYIMNLILLEFI